MCVFVARLCNSELAAERVESPIIADCSAAKAALYYVGVAVYHEGMKNRRRRRLKIEGGNFH